MWKVGFLVLISSLAYAQSAEKTQVAPPSPTPTTPLKIDLSKVTAPNMIPPQTCSIPLLQVKHGGGNVAIQIIAPRQIDTKMIVKPTAPSCPDKVSQPATTLRSTVPKVAPQPQKK
jgi:hypothetical protein